MSPVTEPGPVGGDVPGVDRLLADLARWAGEARSADAVTARSRQQWLRRQAVEEATFAGVALDLAEQSATLVLETVAGRAHRGRLVGVARDFAVLRTEGRALTTIVPWAAVASLRPRREGPGPDPGPRSVPLDLSLVDVLAVMAGSRPRVMIGFSQGQDLVSGELRSVGADMIILRVDAEPPVTLYVRLASVTEVSLLGSG